MPSGEGVWHVESCDFNLGSWQRDITTDFSEAGFWFNKGLNWTYAFNHEEAVACFRKAVAADPGCAMAHWGIAFSSGPFYNKPWVRFSKQELHDTAQLTHSLTELASALSGSCTPVEKALIEALSARYQTSNPSSYEQVGAWENDYADAMRSVHATFPQDRDVAALFAEAAITRTPRRLWDIRTGRPMRGADTIEVRDVLERDIDTATRLGAPLHPGILHIYIHLLEMAPDPERALNAADALRHLCPDAGHLLHMPAHIYFLCGEYDKALDQSIEAVAADDKYLAYAGADNFYTTARCHNLHLYIAAAMFMGRYGQAMAAARRMEATARPELLRTSSPFMASILDGYRSMKTHVLVRFGKWEELIAAGIPGEPTLFPMTSAMLHYGKGVAHAARGEISKAQEACADFQQAVEAIPPEAIFLSNKVTDILAVAAAMLVGEIEYRNRRFDAGYDALREAVHRDDNLNYTEPWAWMHPPRHALGALLLEQGLVDEAEAVYREDLGYDATLPRCAQHPENVWSLSGLVECLERREHGTELVLLKQRLNRAMARADIPIVSSCFCSRRKRSHSGCA